MTSCTCPSDCNCRNPHRPNYCGCKQHGAPKPARQSRWTVTYTDAAGTVRADEILALTADIAADHARTHIAGVGAITVTNVAPAAPRKSRKVADGFDAWAAANGQPATTNVDGYEALGLGSDGAPMFETIAEFAFAVEVAAGPAAGRLFA